MAILFYEGLPGAGKSYEAMATQIIPMLRKGREVVAYIEGLDVERIAEAAELPMERVKELLFIVTREDMRPKEEKKGGKVVPVDGAWLSMTRDNAFHVYDEAQNWWPNRLKATEALTQFVTEHRHRGIDILLMGQSLKDVLALWRRRVDQKFTFLKLTALGTDKRYRVTVYKGQGDDEFVKVSTKVGKYDPKYFGTYRSHVSDDTNTETYTDDRANVLKSGAMKYGAAVAVLLLVWGGWKFWAFFHPDVPHAQAKPVPMVQEGRNPAAGEAQAKPAGVAPPPAPKSSQERYFADLSGKYRIRLAGLMEFGGRVTGVVEWLDGSTRVVERLTLDTLRDLGASVIVTANTVRVSLGGWSELATTWPVESQGRVSEYRQEAMRPAGDAGLPASADGRSAASSFAASPGLTVIAAPKREPAGELTKQASVGGLSSKVWTP